MFVLFRVVFDYHGDDEDDDTVIVVMKIMTTTTTVTMTSMAMTMMTNRKVRNACVRTHRKSKKQVRKEHLKDKFPIFSL